MWTGDRGRRPSMRAARRSRQTGTGPHGAGGGGPRTTRTHPIHWSAANVKRTRKKRMTAMMADWVEAMLQERGHAAGRWKPQAFAGMAVGRGRACVCAPTV